MGLQRQFLVFTMRVCARNARMFTFATKNEEEKGLWKALYCEIWFVTLQHLADDWLRNGCVSTSNGQLVKLAWGFRCHQGIWVENGHFLLDCWGFDQVEV